MCTSQEETLGKGVPSIAQSIISKCSRTWSQERRISVLHRTLNPRISVWDCVPEHIVDTQLRDTFEYLPEQRNYLLDHATPASAVVRSIRRLDAHQSSPLVLNSPRFDSEGEVDANHCAQGSEVSESDSADDRSISRASTPSPEAISEYKDGDTHTIPQDEDQELEDEADRGKPEQWVSYSESENVELCSSSEQSDSDVDDEAFSPEPIELFTIYESDEDVEDDQQRDEPAEANSPEPRELSIIYDSDEDVEDDQQRDEPAEANSPEPRELSTIYESDKDVEDDQQHDEPAEANSPEPRELSIIYESDEDVEDDQHHDEPAEAKSPEPRELSIIYESDEDVEDDQHHDEPAEANSPEPRELSIIYESDEDVEDDQQHDGPAEANSPEPRELSIIYDSDEDVEDDQQRDEPAEANSPEPRELSIIYESDEDVEDDQQHDEPAEANSPEPRELSIIHESDEDVGNDQQYDEPAEASSLEPQQISPGYQFHLEFDSGHQNGEPLEAETPEPRTLSHFRLESPVPDYDGDEKDDELFETESPAPRRLFPVHQFHSTLYDSPQPAPQTETFCPAPLRRFLEPEEMLKFDAFNDWFVHMHMNKHTAIDTNPEKAISETPSPEPRRLFPFRHTSPVPTYGDDEEDDNISEAESPAPRRLFPVYQSHPTVYDPPQSAPQLETFCPVPLRRFLEPEEILKFDASEDWYVRMSERSAIDASPEPRTLFRHRHESPVREHNGAEKDDELFEAESPAPRRLFPVHQSHSTLYDSPQPAPQTETFCPAPLRRFLEPEEKLKFDAFEDWFVRMHMNRHTAIDTIPEKSIPGTPSPEHRRVFPFRHISPVPTYGDDEKDDELFEAESPAPRRLFPVHQSHSTVYDPPQPAPQMESFCPAPLRRFLEPEEILKFDAFEDWFVRMHMSKHTATDTNPEESISETPSPEPRRPFPFRHTSPVPVYGDDEKEDDTSEAESPAPRRLFPVHPVYGDEENEDGLFEAESPASRRLFPVHQSHSAVYDPSQPAPQMEPFCPAPLRRFLEPEEILKFDAFEDWFVRMHMSKHTAIDASPEPRRLIPLRHESPVPKCDNNEKYDSSFEVESPEPGRFFPARQSHSWLNEPNQVLKCEDEVLETMEFIPIESLRL